MTGNTQPANKQHGWYHKYHAWRYSTPLHWIILVCSLFIVAFWFATLIFSANAASVTATITQILLPGNLGVTLPTFLTFTPIRSDSDKEQISTAILKNITMSD